MSFSRLAENRIRQAIEDGAFDNLSNAGKPLDLEDYFSTPAELRMAYSILKNANAVPLEVELFAEIGRLKQSVAAAENVEERSRLQRLLIERETRLNVLLERRRTGEK
jgi:hypothetical protein